MRTDNITLLLLIANLVFSIYAFQKPEILERYKFNVGAVLNRKEYIRIISAGFLHVGFGHLFVNLLTLYFCGGTVYEFYYILFGLNSVLAGAAYLATYFLAMVGGKMLALFTQRNNPGYSAVGASGAIAGILFAFVYFIPEAEIRLFFFLPMPAWVFAILFVGYSLFGMRTGHANIGHEGHLGGAILGMLVAVALVPSFLSTNWWIVLLLLVPTGTYLYLTITRPQFHASLMKGKLDIQRRRRGPRVQVRDPRTRFNSGGGSGHSEMTPQQEMDVLLDKVARKGYDGLTRAEKLRLDELSGRLRERNNRNDNP